MHPKRWRYRTGAKWGAIVGFITGCLWMMLGAFPLGPPDWAVLAVKVGLVALRTLIFAGFGVLIVALRNLVVRMTWGKFPTWDV